MFDNVVPLDPASRFGPISDLGHVYRAIGIEHRYRLSLLDRFPKDIRKRLHDLFLFRRRGFRHGRVTSIIHGRRERSGCAQDVRRYFRNKNSLVRFHNGFTFDIPVVFPHDVI